MATAPARIVILAAIDDTPESDDVLRTAAMLGHTLAGAELHLLNVVEPIVRESGPEPAIPSPSEQIDIARKLLDRMTGRARDHFTGRIVGHLSAGTPWREIVQMGTNLRADLIVVGSHRRNRVERWLLGSVCEQVVRKAPCAVLVAKPRELQDARVPEIEPACPDCLVTQRETKGENLWCAAHARPRSHLGRLHYEMPQSFGVGSMLLRPEG